MLTVNFPDSPPCKDDGSTLFLQIIMWHAMACSLSFQYSWRHSSLMALHVLPIAFSMSSVIFCCWVFVSRVIAFD